MPFLLIVKLIVIGSCAGLKLIGELFWHDAQRWILPAILGIGVSIVTHTWWLGILVYPCCGTLDLGYDDYGKWSDGFDRAMWLGLICVVAGLACLIFHHLFWLWYTLYCLAGFIWGGISRKWWNVIIAPISGLIIGSMIFFVH